ncbi:MAG: AMP-binding protein, partial [Clostridia bacterium]|nr:AMP-binding protein [Clostridia bacterium]
MANVTTGLDLTIREMAARIRELRQVEGLSPAQMAEKTGVTAAEYLASESGERDLNFAFLYRCALAFGVDVTDLIQGSSPTLTTYALTRAGDGQRIEKAHGMTYYNMASSYKNRIAEPLYTVAQYDEAAQRREIPLTTHEGQEFDLVISGHLKVQVGTHSEVLGPGDTIYYDSGTPHGMIAVGGEDCEFYAVVLNPTEYIAHRNGQAAPVTGTRRSDDQHRVYENFIEPVEDEHGALQSISYKNDDQFNFAFDVVDAIARREPDKLAFLHVANDGTERRFTFNDVKRESGRAANYFKSIGIKKGDKVMLILKRHYQFWFIINALHKLGAVVILAPNQLLEKDIAYRFKAAGVAAIMCTADGGVAAEAEKAAAQYGQPLVRVIVNGEREGWHTFDTEYKVFTSHFDRPEDAACGDDNMLMFFTSGTSGYPKIAVHSFKYPLGHFVTARYWHQVDPNGLHFSRSDTGWAKSLWGKLYGQWLCEAPLF